MGKSQRKEFGSFLVWMSAPIDMMDKFVSLTCSILCKIYPTFSLSEPHQHECVNFLESDSQKKGERALSKFQDRVGNIELSCEYLF